MNVAITTNGQAAIAGASQCFAPRANPGRVGFAADLSADARAEARTSAAMAAQVRTEHGDRPGCIRNMSPHGVMLSMATPSRRGDFVEIVAGRHSLIGQVRWVSDCRAGIALRDSIDVNSVMSGDAAGSIAAKPKPVRKAMSVPAAVHVPRDSHIIARQLQFAATIVFGVAAALMIAFCVNDLLTDVISQVRTGLPG